MAVIHQEGDLTLGAPHRSEPRWPVALSMLVVLALLVLMPGRVRLLPPWALYAGTVPVLASLAVAAALPRNAIWLRIERLATLAFVAAAGVANLAILAELISGMIRRSQVADGLHLLSSSIAIWATNVLMFSLLYWQLDRGGPGLRASAAPAPPDWIFPSDQAPPGAVKADWRPQFIDYLFLGFSTATAFSTTDALPLTGRAKVAMMVESTVSLVTLAVVAARAINILGT
jgi:hypothetical protein